MCVSDVIFVTNKNALMQLHCAAIPCQSSECLLKEIPGFGWKMGIGWDRCICFVLSL